MALEKMEEKEETNSNEVSFLLASIFKNVVQKYLPEHSMLYYLKCFMSASWHHLVADIFKTGDHFLM